MSTNRKLFYAWALFFAVNIFMFTSLKNDHNEDYKLLKAFKKDAVYFEEKVDSFKIEVDKFNEMVRKISVKKNKN